MTLAARVGAVFAEEALQAAGGPAWSHPALTGRERSIAVITALAAQGVSGDRLSTHLRLGRQHGLDEAALSALMMVLAGYIGYPRASLAMETIHGSFASGGVLRCVTVALCTVNRRSTTSSDPASCLRRHTAVRSRAVVQVGRGRADIVRVEEHGEQVRIGDGQLEQERVRSGDRLQREVDHRRPALFRGDRVGRSDRR